ncbi:MAG TPA: hypothetical protein VFX84_02975 [Candidatus Saccharimonadales bacterium]|nr:hypothetical protein [Candidatus Saccharimonadales bacterium]
MLSAVSGASIAEASRMADGRREIPLAGSLVIAQRLREVADPETMMKLMEVELNASKAVALRCDRPESQTDDSRWRLLTGYYVLDGARSSYIHTIDPRDEQPGQLRRAAIVETMGSASKVLAYALSTAEA